MFRKISFLILLFFMNASVMAANNFMEFGDVNFGRDFKEKSKWILNLGGGLMQYPTTLPEYSGEHQSYKSESTYEINGYNFNIGRDFYIGSAFSISVGLGAFYAKTLDKVTGKAAADIDLDYSEARESFRVVSYEASIALNYLLDYRIVDVQPFIEFGTGAGTSEIKVQYSTLGLTGEDNSSERYDVTIDEQYTATRLSLGVNFISYKGFMSYFKLSSIQMFKSSRDINGESNLRGTADIVNYDSSDSSLSESKSASMVSLGIGSYF